jgi:hypothetical protein
VLELLAELGDFGGGLRDVQVPALHEVEVGAQLPRRLGPQLQRFERRRQLRGVTPLEPHAAEAPVSLAVSWTVVLSAEMVGANRGLGALIWFGKDWNNLALISTSGTPRCRATGC